MLLYENWGVYEKKESDVVIARVNSGNYCYELTKTTEHPVLEVLQTQLRGDTVKRYVIPCDNEYGANIPGHFPQEFKNDIKSILQSMKSVSNLIETARRVCDLEPEINFDEETGMIQIWNYKAEYGQAFHIEDYCRADEIDVRALVDKLDSLNDISYVTTLLEAVGYESGGDYDEL